jgi:hypothetical protein
MAARDWDLDFSNANNNESPCDASARRYPDAESAVNYAIHSHSVNRLSKTVCLPLKDEGASLIAEAWPPVGAAPYSQ